MSQEVNESISETAAATPMANDIEEGQGAKKKTNVRTGDKSNEQVVIPKNRILIVFIGLMLTVFLAALDQTIVCTLPFRQK